MRSLERLDEEAGRDALYSEWHDTILGDLPHPAALLPGYNRMARTYGECGALLDSLRIAVALRRFKADMGLSAPTLEALVPGYLSDLPRDPFTGDVFLLKRDGGLVTVYSVGPNRVDDRGAIEEDAKHFDSPDVGVQIAE